MNVYVVAPFNEGPSKIGVASNPDKRLRALQTGNPFRLSLRHVEEVGSTAKIVERALHRALADRRFEGGHEWFDLRPTEARALVRSTVAAVGILSDDKSSLSELSMRATKVFLHELNQYEIACEESGEGDAAVLYETELPSGLQILAGTVAHPQPCRFSFKDYVLTWDVGMWLRWSFERMGTKMPPGKRIEPFLVAVAKIDSDKVDYKNELAKCWIEWSVARELRPQEASELARIWDEFARRHNTIERDGPQWATHGIDDHVDDVHVFILGGDRERGDRNYVVFWHEHFRAVLLPERHMKLWEINPVAVTELFPLGSVPVGGFAAPVISPEIWEHPFMSWLRDAPSNRDQSLERFLGNTARHYPEPRPYDESKPATDVFFGLPCIDEYGTY